MSGTMRLRFQKQENRVVKVRGVLADVLVEIGNPRTETQRKSNAVRKPSPGRRTAVKPVADGDHDTAKTGAILHPLETIRPTIGVRKSGPTETRKPRAKGTVLTPKTKVTGAKTGVTIGRQPAIQINDDGVGDGDQDTNRPSPKPELDRRFAQLSAAHVLSEALP